MKAALVLLLLHVLASSGGCLAQQSQQLQQASVSCNAAYSAPCARTNSEYLATITAAKIGVLDEEDADWKGQITNQDYNLPTGFYPFVVDKATSVCVAHGANPDLVGRTLDDIFQELGIAYSDPAALHARFSQGGWVSYLWSDGGRVNKKLAYVVANNITSSDQYYLGVGYENKPLPRDWPCSDKTDGWCALQNVRSLVGAAQFELYAAESLHAFEETVFDLSFDEDGYFKIGGFYPFLYNFDGRLTAHGVLHGSLGQSLEEIYVDKELGTGAEGLSLHSQFVEAVRNQESAWVQYDWRNSLDEETYTKIAFLVRVVFDNEDYYLGVGFNFAIDGFQVNPLGEACDAAYNLPCSFRTAFQLSSHALSHAISSPLEPVNTIFDRISKDSTFQTADFYVFVYNVNSTCVAHGGDPSFVGKTLEQVFQQVGIPLDAAALHEQFRYAAQQGGGWVLYDWLDSDNAPFEKISYLFQINLDGETYYGGVGFNHDPYPVEVYSEMGFRKDGTKIPCSPDYGLDCSEINSQAILGEALADLTVASSDVSFQTDSRGVPIELTDVMVAITGGDESYRINDFYVAVFAMDVSEECESNDGSGCCIAHGGDKQYVGKTWQDILEMEEIASIQGVDLHRQLISTSSTGGGFIEYPYSRSSGAAQIKHARVARFRNDGQSYYVLSEYLTTAQPPTCDTCPSDTECTRNAQSFCESTPEPPFTESTLFIALVTICVVGAFLAVLLYWWQQRKYRLKKLALANQLDQMATRLEQQMQGMVKVKYDLPIHSPDEYRRKFGDEKADGSKRGIAAVWYWEEDDARISSHKKEFVLDGTNFVGYSREISEQIEDAFQKFGEGRGFSDFRVDLTDKIASTNTGAKLYGADTGSHYEVSFKKMEQSNSKTKYARALRRIEIDIADEGAGDLPLLPDDIDFSKEADDKEDLLPTFKGQVIQVSKIHPGNEWLFGNVLYDPLMDDALQQSQDAQPAGLSTLLANALHDRPTSGWFPKTVSEPADVNVMHKLVQSLGGEGMDALTPPPAWAETGKVRVNVPVGSAEFDEVANFFKVALYGQRDKVKVTNVARVENLPLWQSYAVKTQTMKARYGKDGSLRVNNNTPGVEAMERRWLFHGTQPDVISKIEHQGFNRAFAGRNAVRYGRGVYFARDASYSSHETYSVPDANGVQHMFLCRVAVGDWCKGVNEQLTPDAKPHNHLELFDSTVDNVFNPSVFVIYHDAQAYPEYLVSFKQNSLGIST